MAHPLNSIEIESKPKRRVLGLKAIASLLVAGVVLGGVVLFVRARYQQVEFERPGKPIDPETLQQQIEETRRDRQAFERERAAGQK